MAYFRTYPSQQRDEVVHPATLRQLNDNVYEVFKPQDRPTVEVGFFHGLQRDNPMRQPHISTWCSRGEEPELWLQWLAEKFDGIHILTVAYDAALMKTDQEGNMDIFLISENLLQNLTHHEDGVGQGGCPVVLVGHSLGCLVIKQVLLRADSQIGRRLEGAGDFLDNVRGIFYYSGPHKGAKLPTYWQRGPKLNYLEILNEDVARHNQEFETLRQICKWETAGVTESCKTRMGWFNKFIVKEASARDGVHGSFYTVPQADHFDVCRPENKTSTSFLMLSDFIETFLREDRRRQAPKKNSLQFAPGLGRIVDSITHLLDTGNHRVAIVGMGGCGKTTAARELFDRIGARFEYTCFVDDVKGRMSRDKKRIVKIITKELMRWGREVDKDKITLSILQNKRCLIVLDDVDSVSTLSFFTQRGFRKKAI